MDPLETLRSRNPKDGSVVEAVDIKHGRSITRRHGTKAYDWFKTEPVKRYYLLTTAGVDNVKGVAQEVVRIQEEHGCQVTVGDVSGILKRHLQMLKSPDEFHRQLCGTCGGRHLDQVRAQDGVEQRRQRHALNQVHTSAILCAQSTYLYNSHIQDKPSLPFASSVSQFTNSTTRLFVATNFCSISSIFCSIS